MKNIKDKSKVKFIEEKIELEKNNAIARYGIIQLIEIPGGGVSTPKWFEKWCAEEFKPFKNDFYSLRTEFKEFKEETKQSIESLKTEFNEFKEETKQSINTLKDEMNSKFNKVNKRIDNLVIKNKLKV